MIIIKKYFPIFIFLSFTLLLIGATIFYSPSWGVVDDAQMLGTAHSVWTSKDVIKNSFKVIFNPDWYFRPFSEVWFLLTYHIFKDTPVLAYILIIAMNMFGVFIWGLLLNSVFSEKKNNIFLNIFLFPLTFFLFTPFWNIFMYISLAEKFIFLFGAISIYLIKRYLDTEKIRYFLFSTIFIILSILSKPTGIYLVFVFIIFSVLTLVLKTEKSEVGIFILATNLCLAGCYCLFTIKHQLHGYASQYNLSLARMVNNFTIAPFIIKLLSIVAMFMVFYVIYNVKKQNKFSLEAAFIPLGFLCYIAVILPWGICNYQLSVVAPYVMGMFLPFYSYCNGKSELVRFTANCLILFFVLLTFIYIIKPRISKMADIKKTIIFLKDTSKMQTGSRYFFPPPFMEPAYALSVFTGLKIIYVENGVLSGSMLKDNVNNFIIFNDQDSSIDLAGLQVDKEIYQNDTWRIYGIKKAKNFKGKFIAEFKRPAIENLKVYLKKQYEGRLIGILKRN